MGHREGLSENHIPLMAFIGFTGTPIERQDVNTRAVFGDYISIYAIQRAVEDGATVPIYYESRLAKIELSEELKPKIDEEFEELTEGEEIERKEKLKTKWAQLEAIVGAGKRLAIVAHWRPAGAPEPATGRAGAHPQSGERQGPVRAGRAGAVPGVGAGGATRGRSAHPGRSPSSRLSRRSSPSGRRERPAPRRSSTTRSGRSSRARWPRRAWWTSSPQRATVNWLDGLNIEQTKTPTADTVIEKALLDAIRNRGRLPEPSAQYEIPDRTGKRLTVPDFAYPDRRIAIYCDGFAYHGNREALESDAQKRNLLQSMGWAVLTFWGRQILRNPAACEEQIWQCYQFR